MDLFDSINPAPDGDWQPSHNPGPDDSPPEPKQPDPWDDIDWGPWEDPEHDPSPEAEASILGSDAAGVPSWSSSVGTIQRRLQAILDRLPPEDRPPVIQAFKDGESAARERHALRLVLDAEEIPEIVE